MTSQQAGGQARWRGTRKRDRIAAARSAALKRWHPGQSGRVKKKRP